MAAGAARDGARGRARPAHQARRPRLDRARRRTQGAARDRVREHPQPRRRVRLPSRQPSRGDDPDRTRPRGPAELLRAARRPGADLAAHGDAAGRRARQHHRPPARGVGDRFHQAAARLAALQPRRRVDHDRDRAPLPADRAPAPRRAMTSPPFTIAYRDEHLIVVDKAPGVVVHPARGHHEDTLAQLLAQQLAEGGGEGGGAPEGGSQGGWDPDRSGIVHRLDRDTSGLLVVARSAEALRRLQAALAERRIEREYLALVEGRPPARTGTIEAPIGRDPRIRTRMAVGGAGAREARTHFTLEQALKSTSLLSLLLETGRTHQIRVHLQAIGHSVCGDPEYGTPGMLGLERQFLHATRLAFDHPFTGERIEVLSPLPADLHAALERAEGLS